MSKEDKFNLLLSGIAIPCCLDLSLNGQIRLRLFWIICMLYFIGWFIFKIVQIRKEIASRVDREEILRRIKGDDK